MSALTPQRPRPMSYIAALRPTTADVAELAISHGRPITWGELPGVEAELEAHGYTLDGVVADDDDVAGYAVPRPH